MPKVTIPKARINLRKKEKSDKFGYVRLVFRYKGKELLYPLASNIEVKYWDVKKQELIYNRKYGQKYVDLNKYFRDAKRHTEDIYAETQNLSLDNFKLELTYRLGEKQRPISSISKNTLFGFIQNYIEEEKNKSNNKRGTWKKFITVLNNLEEYAKDRREVIDWNYIDWNFRSDFIDWMYAKPREFSINNAAKVMEVLKQFMNEGLRRKLHKNKTHQEPRFGVQRVKLESKLVLSFAELKKVGELDLSKNKRHDKIRDLFIVGCYTGLRFSDWHKINESIRSEEGIKILEIQTTKTKQLVVIPVLPELDAILQKYEYNLPTCSSQEFNRIIKVVCQKVLLNQTYLNTYSKAGKKLSRHQPKYKDVSSHVCRRSFATNFYKLGIPPSDLMLITGHATEKQFFEYIVLDKAKQAKRFKDMVDRYRDI